MLRALGLSDVSVAFTFENQTGRPRQWYMNSGEGAWWCLEIVSGWTKNMQRGGMGDEARRVG